VDNKYGDVTKQAFAKFNAPTTPTNPSVSPVGAITENQKPMGLDSNVPVNRIQQQLQLDAQNALSGLTSAQSKTGGQEAGINDIIKALGTESQYTNKQLDEQGVTSGQKRLAELQAMAMGETNRLTSDILRNESNAIGTRETSNFLGSQEARMRRESAINSLSIASEAALVQGQTELAQNNVNRMVKAVYEPMKVELESARFNLSRLDKNVLEPAQKAQADATERRLNYEMKQVEKQQNFADSLFKNGAPPSVIRDVLKTGSIEEAMQVNGVGDYLMSPIEKLDMQLKGLQIKKVRQELVDGTSKETVITQRMLPNGKLDIVNELTQTIGATKENFPGASAAVGVLSGIQKIATESDGKFRGVAPFRLLPGLSRGKEARQERISNRGDFAALDLKVQQWASGASLTNSQEKKVKRMIPDKNDTDFAVKEKLNNLTSYMQSQAEAELATKGVTYTPSKVDWFAEANGISYDEGGNMIVGSGSTEGLDNASFFGK
jgi:hypothetical protein